MPIVSLGTDDQVDTATLKRPASIVGARNSRKNIGQRKNLNEDVYVTGFLNEVNEI